METREAILGIPSRIKLAVRRELETAHLRSLPDLRRTETAPNRRPALRSAPMISVIIPAYNEEAYLRRTLNAVNRQDYQPYEVIVVANGCSDQTAAIARGHCDKLILAPETGLSRARNMGAHAACGELLLFLDADTLLEWDALENVAQRFARKYAAGTLKGKPDSDRLIYRLIYATKNFMHRWSLHEGSSGVILCWKDDFLAMRGFDEALELMENSDLINKLGTLGKYLYIEETAAITSMRRYEKRGVGRAGKLWFKFWLQSLFSNVRHERYEAIR